MDEHIAATPIWMEEPLPPFPTLDRDLDVDVVIVGAGLTGITTAYLLRQEGASVALLERGSVATGDTGKTTAHLTYVTDTRFGQLVACFGMQVAKAVWQAGASAIERIASIAAQTGVDCDFRRVPGYLHGPLSADLNACAAEARQLRQDAVRLKQCGFSVEYLDSVAIMDQPGIRFENQAYFHPRKYLAPLLAAIPNDESYVFEYTMFEGVELGPLTVRANGRRIRCRYVVIATHEPLIGSAANSAFDTKRVALHTSYVVGARLPKGSLPEAVFWDTGDPYRYLRVDDRVDHQYVIFGGEDVPAGEERDAKLTFERLAACLRTFAPRAEITHRWSGRLVQTDDGLPFIGEYADREFIATGFCGNGFTFGTLSAFMARDRFLGRPNPWFELFGFQRGKPGASPTVVNHR